LVHVKTDYPKYKRKKRRTGGVAEGVEHLSSKNEALRPNLRTALPTNPETL
jgi:hypothetical protein